MNIHFPRASVTALPTGGLPAGVTAGTGAKAPEYGLYAILAGMLLLGGLDSAALAVLGGNISGAVAVIGAISTPVVAMVSAYFGMKAGAQSGSDTAAAAGKARQQAETEVKSLLGHMAPDQAVPVMRTLGIPVADDAPPAAA